MRCENCGRGEVNFHYRSNINGKIMEKHLCMDCAAELGLTNRGLNRPQLPLEEVFLRMFGMRPDPRLFGGFGMLLPTFFVPAVVPQPQAPLGEPVFPTDEKRPEVDDEMKKRREINILREQMYKAAAEEDYEKAAALRDCIKKLEGADTNK
jgi:protein-arginine kinase activator protein McsA